MYATLPLSMRLHGTAALRHQYREKRSCHAIISTTNTDSRRERTTHENETRRDGKVRGSGRFGIQQVRRPTGTLRVITHQLAHPHSSSPQRRTGSAAPSPLRLARSAPPRPPPTARPQGWPARWRSRTATRAPRARSCSSAEGQAAAQGRPPRSAAGRTGPAACGGVPVPLLATGAEVCWSGRQVPVGLSAACAMTCANIDILTFLCSANVPLLCSSLSESSITVCVHAIG